MLNIPIEWKRPSSEFMRSPFKKTSENLRNQYVCAYGNHDASKLASSHAAAPVSGEPTPASAAPAPASGEPTPASAAPARTTQAAGTHADNARSRRCLGKEN